MSVTTLDLLNICDNAYVKAPIVAGPGGRDGADVLVLPTGEIVLVFRGTLVESDVRSVLDWLNDLGTLLVHESGLPGRVHHGFLRSLNDLWPGILEVLEQKGFSLEASRGTPPWNDPDRKTFYITGHSKGGALAILAGCRLQALFPRVVTFAAPMVGDVRFAANYPSDVPVTRYEGVDDLVPWLPPLGYRSIGSTILQADLPWDQRHHHAQHLVADLFDPLTQKAMWKRIRLAHSLETGYKPWVGLELLAA